LKRFGLIGYPLSHSFSKKYFTEKFEKEGIDDAMYELYPLKNASEFVKLIQTDKSLCGLNVTVPFKTDVLEFLDQVEEEALSIGAVNTIKVEREADKKAFRLIGYNTDVHGFKISLKPLLKKGQNRALVLGTGGSSRAVTYALAILEIPFLQVSREPKSESDISYIGLNEGLIQQHNLIINCTPLGMYPDIDQCPDIPYDCIGPDHLVYDLIYNPAETELLKRCKEKGASIKNGLEMLEIQAEKSWKIWNQ